MRCAMLRAGVSDWSKTETQAARRPPALTFNQETGTRTKRPLCVPMSLITPTAPGRCRVTLSTEPPTAQSEDEQLEHYFGPEYLRTRLHVNQSPSNLPLATRGHVERVRLPYAQVANV